MPTFTYQARDEAGRLIKGVFEADSRAALAHSLKKMGYLVTRVEEAARGEGMKALVRGRAVSEEALLMTAIQLSNLLEAGVPLVSALDTVASQTPPCALKGALEVTRREIEGGTSFSQSLSHQPSVFPTPLVRLVAVGEESGHLDTVLNRFAISAERDLALRRAVMGALLYPCILLAAATLLILVVVTLVVPQFASLFAKAGISLPLPTRILQAVGGMIRSRWWLLGLLAGAASLGWGILYRIPSVRLETDRLLLKVPFLGQVIDQTNIARFTRTLGTLVGSGVPILSSLETASGLVENRVILEEIKRVGAGVEQGQGIAALLSKGKVFPLDAVQMIRVGEETGRLDLLLAKIADFYEMRVNYSLKQMTTLFEPVLLAVLG
ncbi:MAG: type II secretion system F family protein, partial [Candidatus Omnitrophica bacterium]|nr:type II secretion system F family protein [Candidatus Omnitrophota bacterium]